MNKYDLKSFQRILSLILCLAMMTSFVVPVWATETETTDTSQGSGVSGMSENVEYVSLPITIRDFAADGMLFEFNQTDKQTDKYAYRSYEYETESVNAGYDWDSNNSLGYRIRTYATHGSELPGPLDWWYCVICNADGTVKKVLPAGENSKTDYASYMTAGCFSVWMWIGDGTGNENDLEAKKDYNSFRSMIPEGNPHGCTVSYNDSLLTVTTKYKYVTIDNVDYIVGDNNGFTMLLTDSSDYINNLTDSNSIPGTNVVQNTTAWNATTPPAPVQVTLNSGAPQTVNAGSMRLDLVTAELDKDKNVVYTEATVDYVANLLETMLNVPYTITLGDFTYRTSYYLLGTKLYDSNNDYVGKSNNPTKDLADVFRACINGGAGTYAAAKARFDAGELQQPKDVDTYYEAAYYLLHSVWSDNATEGHTGNDGYGWNTWNYDKINLIQTTNDAGQKCYVFNSGYDNTAYEPMSVVDGVYEGSGAIYNTQVSTMTPAKGKPVDANGSYIGDDVYSNGIVLPNARFDPLGTSGSGKSFGYGMDAGTYCEMMEAYPDRGELFYPTTNYHHTLEGHAKFIYYKDANQYFTFTGDDDVYLYINGKRVLDLGGAHAIAEVSINLNDVAKLCGLSDGMTYDFDFYYMERHGTAANFGIETNIQIVDPSMLTTKEGFQNGVSTGYNGYVNPDIPVTYAFGLENNGETPIQNLTFEDKTIGVSLTKDAISLNALTTMDDLSVTLYGSDGQIKSSVAAGDLTEEALKNYLESGLLENEKIVIHGFSYKILNDDWACRYVDENGNGQYDEGEERTSNWYFFNIIYTTATAIGENSSTKDLTGTSNWVVQKLEDEKMGNLTITKQLDENASHTLLGKIFTMQVLLDGKPIPAGTAYAYTTENGNTEYLQVQTAGQIPLAVGATAKLRAAYGTAFQVSELIAEADREVYHATYEAVNAEVTDSGVSGAFTENAEAKVTVTNHTLPGNLLETNKWVTGTDDPNKFTLTLESFVKGELTNVATTTPADFVLVLDQSASMYAPAGGDDNYDNSKIIGNLSSSVDVTKLDKDKAQHMGYYVAQSYSGRTDSNGEKVYDWFLVQRIGEKWYFVRKDKTAMPVTVDTVNARTDSSAGVGETLVRSEPITTFNYYQSGYGALYDAVTGFVDSLKDTGVDHRVAVVGFASPCYDAMEYFDGSGVYVNGEYYLYDAEYLTDSEGYYTYNFNDDSKTKIRLTNEEAAALNKKDAATVYDKALVSVKTNAASVEASLNAVTTNYWHTCPAAGLDMANQILEATPANGRNRTVLLFTDGEPTVRLGANYLNAKDWTETEDGLYVANTYWTVCEGKDSAIEQAIITKDTHGANIHTIGTAGAGADTLFLDAVSSDYPNATHYPTAFVDENGVLTSFADDDATRHPYEYEIRAGMGDPIANPMFSHFVTDEISLDDIFEDILQTTTNLELGADAVLKEVLTDYFELDNNAVADVKVYTALYDGQGNFGEKTELASAKVTLSSSDGTERLDTIEVTGYDYAAEFVSDTARQKLDADGNVLISEFYGSKLIVEVQIETRPGFWGGNNVPTNEDSTAIYEKTGDLVDKFPEPQVNVPMNLTLAADDAVVYYGSDELQGGLLTELTAGGLPVNIGEDGTLSPQADWMDDFATLTWTGDVTPNADLSTTEPGEYTYSAKLVPNTDGTTNTCTYPSNMAGEKVPTSGLTAQNVSTVDVLVPVIPFQDSTIYQGETPDEAYFNRVNLVDQSIEWVLKNDTDATKAATHGEEPTLTFAFDPHLTDGTYVEATPVDVTVSAQYGDADPMDFTGVSYFDWQECTNKTLHDEGTIPQHLGSIESQNEFWIHVADSTPDSGLVTDKTVEATEDANEFVLTLEAYAQGKQETVTLTKPADIVLVLDHSGSMRTPVGAPQVLESGTPYTGGGAIDRSQISVEKAKHRGYYVAQSAQYNANGDAPTHTWFVMEYVENYHVSDTVTAPRWVGYSVHSTESIVDTTGGYTEHTQVLTWVPGEVDGRLVFYKSQYGALYDTMLSFVDNLKRSGVEHNVSIVGFAGSATDGSRLYVGGDETIIKSYDALYHVNTSDDRRAELFEKSMKNVQNATEYAELLAAIEAMETNFSYTCPSAGLKIASDLYKSIGTDGNDRDSIVVLFTDGIPNRQIGEDTDVTVDDAKQNAIFNEIVEYAYAAKQQGATIYSISTTTLKEGANGENRTFLSYASSDYPNAVDFDNPGSPIADPMYTTRVENLDDFSKMFDSVTSNISSTTVTLNETAILKEVLTDYFVLNPDDEVDVEIYTAAHNGDGTFAEPVLRTEAEGFKYTLSSSESTDRMDTIEVTGFDYAGEYVSSMPRQVDGKDYYGSKLVVKVKVRTRNGFWGGNNVPTNEESTGIYDQNRFPVEDFPEPEVNVPISVDVIAKDKTIYYDGDVTAKDLIDSVTIGGEEVTVNDNGTFTPTEDWMNDYADLKWTDNSTKPGDTPDNHTPKDYTFEVQATPKYDGTENRQEDPSNIAGNIDGGTVEDTPSAETTKTDKDIGHVYILIPELTFKDSTTEFGTNADGYDYNGNDYVSSETVWKDMEGNRLPGEGIPTVDEGVTAPELDLTYTPDTEGDNALDNNGTFVTDTKVNVNVSIGGTDITDLVQFDWKEDCTSGNHTEGMDIGKHPGTGNSNEFWIHVTLKLVPDTVVIDFGLDVVIDVLANDPIYSGVSPVLSGIGAKGTNTFSKDAVTGAFGQLSINSADSTKVRYTLNRDNGMQMNQEEVFEYQATYTIKDKTSALSETVTVIPATTIYYEDEFVDFSIWSYDPFEKTRDDWDSDGTAATRDQAQDRPGDGLSNVDADNIYGYDSAYTDMSTYSMGSAKKVTLNKDIFAEAQFTFWGTGFDVVSLTNNNTGTILVDVYEADVFDVKGYEAPRVKSYLVDTYYGYKYALCEVTYIANEELVWERSVGAEAGTDKSESTGDLPTPEKAGDKLIRYEMVWIVDPEADDTLYQVPVMKVKDLPYGRYTAVITVDYMSSRDHQNQDGQYDFYLDAIRIYDPANDGADSETIKNAYTADGEGWPEYFELRNLIISKNDFDSLAEGTGNGIVFIDNTLDANNQTTYTISDYTNYGPNNELYLAPGQAIAFDLNVPDPSDACQVAGIHLAMKSVGGEANVTYYTATGSGNAVERANEKTMAVATATDLYYDITGLNNKTVVITNTGGAILSVTNVKVTYNSAHTDSIEHSYFPITQTVAKTAVASLMMMSAPEVSESVAVNETTGTAYATLAEALDAAQQGDTIKLLANAQESHVMVSTGITLDLNGKILTADYVVGFSDTDIVDNAGSGKLIVDKKNVVLDEANGMMPVYDGEGYLFTKVGFAIRQDTAYTGEGIKISAVAYPVNMAVVELLKNGAADNNLQVAIELTWDTDQGTGSQQFVFTDEVVASVYSSNQGSWTSYGKMFSMVITGIETVDNLRAGIMLVSDTNVRAGSMMKL